MNSFSDEDDEIEDFYTYKKSQVLVQAEYEKRRNIVKMKLDHLSSLHHQQVSSSLPHNKTELPNEKREKISKGEIDKEKRDLQKMMIGDETGVMQISMTPSFFLSEIKKLKYQIREMENMARLTEKNMENAITDIQESEKIKTTEWEKRLRTAGQLVYKMTCMSKDHRSKISEMTREIENQQIEIRKLKSEVVKGKKLCVELFTELERSSI